MDLVEYINTKINLDDTKKFGNERKNYILSEIKKHINKKYKNEDIIKSSVFFSNQYLNNYQKNIENINKKKEIVDSLMKLELPEQRSPEWYQQRKKVLTASSLATACNKDHFKSKEELILDKISIEETPFIANPITEWGVKYEEIAIMMV